MTKRLHGMILRMLPAPIVGWFVMLMFLLLMQFLIKYLPDIAGKGLPFGVVVELIAYNLSYMVVLAVPMSILIGTMMVFGKIAESRAYVVIKSAGISPIQLIWPSLVVGVLLTGGMMYFNNVVLPEANFRARNLWQDIREKRPGFELREGVFYEGLDKYSILVQEISEDTEVLRDVLVYDYTSDDRSQAVIKAREGRLHSSEERPEMVLTLFDGEIHRLIDENLDVEERYERMAFDRYKMRLDLSDFQFERSSNEDGYRSDRTMRTGDMVELVDSLEISIQEARLKLLQQGLQMMRDPEFDSEYGESLPTARLDTSRTPAARRVALAGMDPELKSVAFDAAISRARTIRAMVDDTYRTIRWEAQRADRFRVEIHKKFSIAIACLIFVLIGAPLGLTIRRGGLGKVGLLASGIFLFYWVTLVQGEKLADRGYLEPWVGMWAANIVMIVLGLWLMVYVTMDLRATTPLRRRFLQRLGIRR